MSEFTTAEDTAKEIIDALGLEYIGQLLEALDIKPLHILPVVSNRIIITSEV